MRISFLLICTILSFQYAFGQNETAKGSLFIIGGGSRPAEMIDRIIAESGIDKGGYAVVLPMSSQEPDSAIYYTRRQYTERGINNMYGLNFIDGEKFSQAKLDSIRNARLVYISGGDQSRFMKIVAGTDIETAIHDAYKNGALIGGTSAGAAVMSTVMITGNELKHPDYSSTFRSIESNNIETKPGLGLLKTAIIDQHFIWRSRHNRLISAVIEFPHLKCIGIDESTAIFVKGNSVEVIGDSQVIVYANPQKSKIEHNGKLGARDILLNVYLPGDTFLLDQ